MEIDFRQCTLDDLNTLKIISIETYKKAFSAMNTQENMQEYIERAFNKHKLAEEIANPFSYIYFVYYRDLLAGYFKINECEAQTDIQDPSSLELERIYVKETFQSRHLGGQIIDFTVKLAKTKQKSYIWLGVWEKNLRAIAFYERNGFVKISSHAFRMGSDVQTDYIMKRIIYLSGAEKTNNIYH